MKTIITSLPIYDKLAKQCYERSEHLGGSPTTIVCPRHRLPSFQWIDGTDGAASVTTIELYTNAGLYHDITDHFTLPGFIPLAHDYFAYGGSTLLQLMDAGVYYLKITMNNAKVYYSEWFKVDCIFTYTGMTPVEAYSTKYLIINFHNDCDLGELYYHGVFTQTLWLETEPMEPSFPIEEEGIKNGEGRFIRTFARQTKKYLVRTNKLPDYMVDVFHRLKLHDTITLTDLVGDTNTVYNLEVDHEYLGDDKYYAKIELTFDYNEVIVTAGCCNNIT